VKQRAVHLMPLDSQGLVRADFACMRCKYNLRGLAHDNHCPECGLSIVRSLRGDRLSFSDPAWVQRLARGTLWILAACGVLLLGILLYIAGGMLALLWPMMHEAMPWQAGGIVILAALLLLAVGMWKITELDPHSYYEEQLRHAAARLLARYAMSGVVLLYTVRLAAASWGVEPQPPDLGFHAVAALALWVQGVAAVALMERTRMLADRMGNAHLARGAAMYRWWLGLPLLMLALTQTMQAFAALQPGTPQDAGVTCIVLPAGLMLLAAVPLAFSLLVSLHKCLSLAAEEAVDRAGREARDLAADSPPQQTPET
jgi:hypothetical protein